MLREALSSRERGRFFDTMPEIPGLTSQLICKVILQLSKRVKINTSCIRIKNNCKLTHTAAFSRLANPRFILKGPMQNSLFTGRVNFAWLESQ